ncbi:hypothetical protein SBF1_480019 [Candidatus Desulfosporosinus infrequens]|uniref:Uncharacterized protein n=1 Tax=Candidatus Desulfosporosinus infrequens TaxID=2043169 RepID=A0A2U3LEW8_9FIRM|nr:hypothetical protein SBF1_480019 [Candidatus Desulfosporosinus infrequens]
MIVKSQTEFIYRQPYFLDSREKLYLQIELRIIIFVTIQVLRYSTTDYTN